MSSDFLKAQNAVADAQDHGFVKIIGAKGQIRNVKAYQEIKRWHSSNCCTRTS